MKKLEITAEKVLEVSRMNSMYKHLMVGLFPEVFEDEKPFCKIGSVFTRLNYPDNFYAVVKINGYITIMNITYSSFWDEKRKLSIHELSDIKAETLTKGEFKRLCGNERINEIKFYNKPSDFKK